jgi:hypothetical protein
LLDEVDAAGEVDVRIGVGEEVPASSGSSSSISMYCSKGRFHNLGLETLELRHAWRLEVVFLALALAVRH